MRMKIFGVSVMVLAATAQTMAMPTRAELSKVQPMVVELMAPALEEYKSAADKVAGAVKVGDSSCAFAAEAETEAAKFLLLKGAVSYYVRGEAYDKAADCIAAMQSEIKDFTPDVVVEIVGKATSRISETKAPRLVAYYRAAKLQVRARKELPVLEKKLKRVKTEQLQRQYAEALAISGNWKAAYDAFAKSGNANLSKIAEAEAKGTAANEQAAELWWNYKPEFEGAENFFKTHAVEFYQKAFDNGEISGLKKNIVGRRIAQITEAATAPAVAKASKESAANTSKWAIPANFKEPLVQTLKLSDDVDMDFCVCPAGTFQMSNVPEQEPRHHKVTITRPFWISRQFVTSQQNRAVGGKLVDDDVAQKLEKMFPENDTVLRVQGSIIDAFISAMNEHFGTELPKGYVFRLPTEAELEYAVRAGGRYNSDAVYVDKSRTRKALASKGLLSEEEKNAKELPREYKHLRFFERTPENPWKLIGGWTDAAQLTLDHVDVPKGVEWTGNPKENLVYANEEVDPLRSGNRWLKRQWHIGRWLTTGRNDDIFRVVIGPDLVAEKMAGKTVEKSAPAVAPPVVHEEQSAPLSTVAVKPAAAPVRVSNGKEISVQLKTGVTMDFVPCPAGTFEMGLPGDDNPRSPKFHHTVQITRPFWIGKYLVTWRQWMVFNKAQFNDVINALGGPDAAKDGVTYNMAKQFCESMNKKFKKYLPKSGYVYRLPTEAEWVYALYANCKDESDPHAQFLSGNKSAVNEIAVTEDDKMKMVRRNGLPANRIPEYVWPPMKVGTKKPNVWGIYDMLGNGSELILDTCQIDNFKKHWGRNEHTDLMRAFPYKEKEVDPLYYAPRNASCPCSCYIRGLHNKVVAQIDRNVEQYACFRLVIGPDLEREQAAKNGKK